MNARFAVVAPDLAKGVRAAITTLVPFYLAGALHRPELAWVALGGWLGALADPGGARTTRALATLVFAVLGGAAIAMCTFAAATVPTAALVVAVIVFAAALARALGATASSLGTSIAIAAAIAASRSGPAVEEGALFAAGVAWAALTSTIALPAWPHLPVRLAVGRVFDRLADYVAAIDSARAGDWPEVARIHQRAVRAAVEEARSTALALRARRWGESAAGANLRVVLGAAEALFFQVIALAEEVEHGASVPAGLAASFQAIARDLYTRRAGARVELEGDGELVTLTRDVAEVASDLDRMPATLVTAGAAPPGLAWEALRDALSLQSPVFAHALRVSITAAVGIVVGRLVTPMHPTWVVVTALVVLQPQLGSTLVKAAERVAGTVLGALVALAAIMMFHSPLALTLAMFPLSVAAVVTRPRSYRLFVLFLTPVFVLVVGFGHSDWHTIEARIIDVGIGGVLALAAAMVVPSSERLRLPDALAAALSAIASYARLAGWSRDRAVIVAARRTVGAALEAAEASLERMLAEPRALQQGAEDAMYLVTYSRRVAAGITAQLEGGGTVPVAIASYLEAVLCDARDHVAKGVRPAPRAKPAASSPALSHLVRRAELIAQRVTER